MKDYTKYDFAAIVGAEVSVLLKSKVEYGGTLKFVDKKNGAIFLLMNDNPMALEGRWFAIEDIVPGTLSVRIKVEDMSVKQLKRFAKIQVEPSGILDVVIRFKEKRIEIFAGWDKKRCVHLFSEQHSLDDYIDCTDWGWKK